MYGFSGIKKPRLDIIIPVTTDRFPDKRMSLCALYSIFSALIYNHGNIEISESINI